MYLNLNPTPTVFLVEAIEDSLWLSLCSEERVPYD